MAKMDMATYPGGSRILIAKPEGFGWNEGEPVPYFDHYIIETDETALVLYNHYKIVDKKLILLSKEEWVETKQANMQKLNDHIDAVLSGDHRSLDEIEAAVAAERAALEGVG